MIDLSIVIVSWECESELSSCLNSLASARSLASGALCELIVIDNASAGFRAETVRAAWPDAIVEVNHVNRGFGPAANQGATLASGRIVLLLNPDTRADGDPFTPLLRLFSERTDVVAAAPRLLDADPPAQQSQRAFQLRRLPTWRQSARELLLVDRLFPRNRGACRDRYLDRDRDAPFQVEQPAAAALAIRRDAFIAVGGFDERFVPAWFEDVDLCARLVTRGRILYWPESRFIHVGNVASVKLGYHRFLPTYYRNAIRFWHKHHGCLAACVYRFLVAVGMLLRILVVFPFPPRSILRRRAVMGFLLVIREAAMVSTRVRRG